jgi:hypothetical protein
VLCLSSCALFVYVHLFNPLQPHDLLTQCHYQRCAELVAELVTGQNQTEIPTYQDFLACGNYGYSDGYEDEYGDEDDYSGCG